MDLTELDIQYHIDTIEPDHARIHAAADWIARRMQLNRLVASIAIVGDEDSRQCNQESLGHDYATDVISFEIERGSDWADGEVIANAQLAERLATQAGWSPKDELLLYIIHGLLHVVGMDDQTERGAYEMREAEQACLQHLDVPSARHHIERWKHISY